MLWLLESAGLAALKWGRVVEWVMLRRWGVMSALIGLGLLLNGCTKCGPIWDDLDAAVEILPIGSPLV